MTTCGPACAASSPALIPRAALPPTLLLFAHGHPEPLQGDAATFVALCWITNGSVAAKEVQWKHVGEEERLHLLILTKQRRPVHEARAGADLKRESE